MIACTRNLAAAAASVGLLAGAALLTGCEGRTGGGGSSWSAPLAFEGADLRLAEAAARSRETGKPVVAFVTAEWCPPCKQMKRTTLSDESVAAWIRENAIPVYIEETERDHGGDLRRLTVQGFPTTFMLAGDEVVDQLVGGHGKDEFMYWLNAASERVRTRLGDPDGEG